MQCKDLPNISNIDTEKVPNTLSGPILVLRSLLERGIDDLDEDKCCRLVCDRLMHAYVCTTGLQQRTDEDGPDDVVPMSVNINLACAKDLQRVLKGVGEKLAKEIIKNRIYSNKQELLSRVPRVKNQIAEWERTGAVRLDGEAFTDGKSSKGKAVGKTGEGPA